MDKNNLMKKRSVYWCLTHDREATHVKENGMPCCDPKLCGIAISCQNVVEASRIDNNSNPTEKEKNKFLRKAYGKALT